jgi:hypothetical protein
MLVNRPVYPWELGIKPGVVLSAPYDYLVGTHSGLADVFGVKNKQLQAREAHKTVSSSTLFRAQC